LDSQIDAFRQGSRAVEFVTPTAYAPWESISALALPGATRPRTHVLVLDPRRIDAICGPYRCQLGFGIEYLLPFGFPATAIVAHTNSGGWAIEVG
jgi:hypothetical protein